VPVTVFRLFPASLPLPIHRVSKSITDGVVARISRGRGNLASVRQPVAQRSPDRAAAVCENLRRP
jgi:hypothetical protein